MGTACCCGLPTGPAGTGTAVAIGPAIGPAIGTAVGTAVAVAPGYALCTSVPIATTGVATASGGGCGAGMLGASAMGAIPRGLARKRSSSKMRAFSAAIASRSRA